MQLGKEWAQGSWRRDPHGVNGPTWGEEGEGGDTQAMMPAAFTFDTATARPRTHMVWGAVACAKRQ